MRTRRALVPLLLVTALTACGGSDDDNDDSSAQDSPTATQQEASGDDVEACDLLTTDEVEAAVGTPVKEGIPSSGPAITGGSYTECVWQSADPDHPGDTAKIAIYENTAAADSVRDDDSQDLEGIGDKAFSVSVSGVWVYDGDRSFLAQWYIFNTMDDEGLEQSKALAKAAADAL